MASVLWTVLQRARADVSHHGDKSGLKVGVAPVNTTCSSISPAWFCTLNHWLLLFLYLKHPNHLPTSGHPQAIKNISIYPILMTNRPTDQPTNQLHEFSHVSARKDRDVVTVHSRLDQVFTLLGHLSRCFFMFSPYQGRFQGTSMGDLAKMGIHLTIRSIGCWV